LVSRILTGAILMLLTVMVAAGGRVSYPLLKISLLTAAEVGLVSVMLGLFLRSNTHFAGFQLLIASLMMLWLAAQHLIWVAVGVGLLFIAVDLTNVITRRSRLNAFLALRAPRLLDEEAHPAARPPVRDNDRSADDGGIF
ncbi:MAG: hypothetical protein H6Q89_4683, partial [Myxococcaceae bacterium]|nr:hypothetical protein [Myxococcaceae bacterium]